jgi:hypothetical protein
MRSRPTGSTGSNGPGKGASLQSGHRAWNLEYLLLVAGLASVFVLGVMLSSRIHMLEPQHGRINYEKQFHAGDSVVKTTWREVSDNIAAVGGELLSRHVACMAITTTFPDSTTSPHPQDYSQSREELMRILTQRDPASSAYGLRKLSLHELIKVAFGVLHGLLISYTQSFGSEITMCFLVDKGGQDSSERAQFVGH